jgi:hypothetical protein
MQISTYFDIGATGAPLDPEPGPALPLLELKQRGGCCPIVLRRFDNRAGRFRNNF